MGAGASTNNNAELRSTFLAGKPLDASDIRSLDDAKSEISRLRQLATTAFDNQNPSNDVNPKKVVKAKSTKKNAQRPGVFAKAAGKDYVKTTIPKSDAVKKLIYNAIKPNTLFRACTDEEIMDLIDAFTSAEFSAGSVVIKQGDNGEHFYVVESGTLDISVKMGGGSQDDLHVGVPYSGGSAFGELALMYGSPRAATIKAREDCKLWCIDRRAFRGITGQYKSQRSEMHLQFLKKVKIGDKVLGDVLKASEIDAMALAIQRDSFRKSDVIVREGETGDTFYIIESGTVEVFKKANGEKPVATLEKGNFFGEKALLSEDVRQATCIASSDVQCLYLTREDFVLMLGDLQDLLDGKDRGADKDVEDKKSKEDVKVDEQIKYDISDLEIVSTLGIGAFGRVKLVKINDDKNATKKTFALKCLSKKLIVENGLQDHVINEKKIMDELNNPFILTYYCAMQDEKYIYFLLEVLLGGELFKCLRAETQFPEKWSKFYSASVLLAFCQIHARKIAYRDLKPENLVMDSAGYLKLVDFGLAKKLDTGKTWTLCGTPDYLAPEVILNEGHDWAVDYWGLGVLIYEMTAGSPPFYADDPMEVYEKILSGNINIPSHFSRGLADLVRKLLKTYQSKRLGRTRGGTGAVMKHKWYSGFDWDGLMSRTLTVPMKPKVQNALDASNFDVYPEEEDPNVRECPEW
eukprot:CAMPEP_0172503214 /NCGR_PEP_ID=MMETSP1066-20121228/167296_1 /TAXON_ID=671091 /ORGANISM="Coscinodiscus wailesii, Strain CCMP2513" /LENGTH=689 /DNA_ID=CAMNT_0013278855 /DNA_START=128 /DNA_END=2194 /DNA_ORIENTATION=+